MKTRSEKPKVAATKRRPLFKGQNGGCEAEVSTDTAYAYLSAIIRDLQNLYPGKYGQRHYTRDLDTLKRRIDAEGKTFVLVTLPTIGSYLLKLTVDKNASLPSLKKRKGTDYPVWLNRLFCLAFEDDDTTVRAKCFQTIYCIAVAFKKLRGSYEMSLRINTWSSFLQCDDEIKDIDIFSSERYPIMECARAYFYAFAKNLDTENLSRFRPGPGSTNTRRRKSERFRPFRIFEQIDRCFPVDEYFYSHPWDIVEQSAWFTRIYNERRKYTTARFKTVPKYVGKPRGICIEENEMQVMQQGLRDALYDHIERYYSPYINLRRQDINANLALKSSLDGKYSTIDFSEASNRVARDIVSWLSQDNKLLHDQLMALSTRYVVCEDDCDLQRKLRDLGLNLSKRVNMYAPMGSALCFPVMTLVHRCLIEGILRVHVPNYNLDSNGLYDIYVYGDDILVRTEYTPLVIEKLALFGMKINAEKSYWTGSFRESCGIHAYNGMDVTPVYLKYTKDTSKANDSYESLLQNFYDLRKSGFRSAAQTIRNWIVEMFPKTDALTQPDSRIAGFCDLDAKRTADDIKQRCRSKWDRNLQCYTYRPLVREVKDDTAEIADDSDAYLRWLWQHTPNPGKAGLNYDHRASDSHVVKAFRRVAVPESHLIPLCPTFKEPVLGVTTPLLSRRRLGMYTALGCSPRTCAHMWN